MNTKLSNDEIRIVTPDVKWKDITRGGTISEAANARLFKTGDWRSMKPVWLQEKCKQCLLCYPVCPDTSVLVNEEGMMTGFDYDHCKGCGVCAKVCPFKAIDFVEESK
ncbi:MAG: 4Fe-4S binding protein [Bacillota bacterium]|nr:4Fe-4S binding protein [Bacillota bacterium]